MNVFTLSWHYAWSKPLSAVLNVLVLALGLGSLAVILMAHQRVQQALERDVAGIDVVVGAKGSPLTAHPRRRVPPRRTSRQHRAG
jgi:putative ABC transport system permease protein